MIARIIHIVCAFYLIAMSMAAAIHWWSLRDLSRLTQASPPQPSPIALKPATPLAPTSRTALETPKPAKEISTKQASAQAPVTKPSSSYPSSNSNRDEFYASLLKQIENLQNQNRDLIDQLAETNRELMKLEFRVDTHSSQFRPLPVTEDRQEAFRDDDQGVLPPRPIIIDEPFGE